MERNFLNPTEMIINIKTVAEYYSKQKIKTPEVQKHWGIQAAQKSRGETINF